MATTEKDFRVKNGLIVAQNATIGGTLDANALQIGGTAVATESYVTTQISNLIDSAPGTLDTLNEIAAAINDDPNFFSSIPTATSDLTNDSGYITSASLPTDISQLTDTTNLIPTNVSDLTNDTGFITSSALSGYATETYVDTAVSNLIDAAPGALDTLNELAAAINDDPNFFSSIPTATSDLTNDSGYITSASLPTDISELTDTTNLIPTQASLSVDDLITLSGVAEGSLNLGTFTGTTINDNQTVKQALQALETEVETKEDAGVAIAMSIALG